ncbi:MAG: hypothetical protein AB4911_13130 [Oscillochloridaceae bacterium umkhey_bin13]
MFTMIVVGLVTAVLLAVVARWLVRTPEPPPVIYLQVVSIEPQPQGNGCLPIIILIGVILFALTLG